MCTQSILLQFLITGFEDIAKACCGTGFFEMGYMCSKINPFTCSDANKYVFWDSFHPTEKTNWIIADHVVRTSLATFLWRSQSIMQHLMVVVLVLIIHNSICWYLSFLLLCNSLPKKYKTNSPKWKFYKRSRRLSLISLSMDSKKLLEYALL